MSEPKDPAVLAAASPDPAVRGFAVRRQELAKEIGKIDSLLNLYVELVEAYQAEQKPPATAPSSDGAMSRENFVPAIRDILLDAGQPLRPREIYEAFAAKFPDYAGGGPDAMRKRLYKLKDCFRAVGSDRHWPIDVAVPSGTPGG